jgi:signal transduction histidine kinase
MDKGQALYKIDDTTEDIFRLQRLVKGSVLTGSDHELDAFFGDLKSAVLIVDSEFKIIYLNNTAKNLTIDRDFDAEKGMMVIDFVKRILTPSSLIPFYEHLINRSTTIIEDGFTLSRIEKLLFNPIASEGFVLKLLLDELYTVSASNLFRYFPGLPIAYFGFDLLPGKRISIRFLSDNFTSLFPFIDAEQVLENDNYFLSYFHPEDLPELLTKLQNLKKGKDSLITEFRVVDKNGEDRWYQLISGRFSEKNDKNFWLAYLEDIHEKKTANIEKQKLIHETLDDERHRMSMELHDGLGQNLVALNLYLSSVLEETESKLVDTCKTLAMDSILMMKALCYNLAPPELDKGLLHALDVFFGKANELSTSIEYEFIAKKIPSKQLSAEKSYNIFRIVQEFVSNSQKYAQCKKITCELTIRNSKTLLMIHDDGVGFDPNKIKNGFGLKNMEKRAKLLDAKMEFNSKDGEGTLLLLEF